VLADQNFRSGGGSQGAVPDYEANLVKGRKGSRPLNWRLLYLLWKATGSGT